MLFLQSSYNLSETLGNCSIEAILLKLKQNNDKTIIIWYLYLILNGPFFKILIDISFNFLIFKF